MWTQHFIKYIYFYTLLIVMITAEQAISSKHFWTQSEIRLFPLWLVGFWLRENQPQECSHSGWLVLVTPGIRPLQTMPFRFPQVTANLHFAMQAAQPNLGGHHPNAESVGWQVFPLCFKDLFFWQDRRKHWTHVTLFNQLVNSTTIV